MHPELTDLSGCSSLNPLEVSAPGSVVALMALLHEREEVPSVMRAVTCAMAAALPDSGVNIGT